MHRYTISQATPAIQPHAVSQMEEHHVHSTGNGSDKNDIRSRKRTEDINAVLKDLNSRNIRSDLEHDVILTIDSGKINTQMVKRNKLTNRATESPESDRILDYDFVFVEKIEVSNQVRLLVIRSLYKLMAKGLLPQNAITYRTTTEYGFKLKYEWDATRAFILEHRSFTQWSKPTSIESGKKKNCYLKNRFGMKDIPEELKDMVVNDRDTFGKIIDAYKKMHDLLKCIDLRGNICVIAFLTERDFETGDYSSKIVCEFINIESSFLNIDVNAEVNTVPTILIEFRRRRKITQGFVVRDNKFLWKYSSEDRNDCGFRLWTFAVDDSETERIENISGLIMRPDIQIPLRKKKEVFEISNCDFNIGDGSDIDTGTIHKEGVYFHRKYKENGLSGIIGNMLDLGINSTKFIHSVIKLTFGPGTMFAKCDMFINKTVTYCMPNHLTPLFHLVIEYGSGPGSFLPIHQENLGNRARAMARSMTYGEATDTRFDVLDYQSQIMTQLKARYNNNIRDTGMKDTRTGWLCWLHKHWNDEATAVNRLQCYDRLVSLTENRTEFQWSNGVKRVSTEAPKSTDDTQ